MRFARQAGRRPAAADAYDSFVSSYLRIFALIVGPCSATVNAALRTTSSTPNTQRFALGTGDADPERHCRNNALPLKLQPQFVQSCRRHHWLECDDGPARRRLFGMDVI
jgi:hypothetical protein